MSNPIKYSTGTESLALKKGNFYIGTGDVGKGPTSSTGYYNGITPPTGGYTIYLNKETGGPSIYTVANDTQLISLTNSIAGASYTTANECLVYFAGQTDKMVLNRNYEGIVTDGLVFNLDAGFTPSYSRSGTTWYDVGGTNNGTLVNGPTFNSDNGGSIVFDGTDDFVDTNFNTNFSTADFTLSSWAYPEFDSDTYGRPIMTKNGNGSCNIYDFALEYGRQSNRFSFIMDGGTGSPSLYSTTFSKNNWYNAVATREYLGGTNYKCSIYINGSLNVTTTGNFTGGNGSKMTIGNFVDCNPVGEWLGKISISQLYNRALSATEVLQNYNAQKGRFGL
jgi:hypothetical protein